MNKTLYIFRHGQTYATKHAVAYGKTAVTARILPEDVKVIKKIGVYLKDKEIGLFLSSEFDRCKETATIVAKEIRKDFTTDERLNDYVEPTDFGTEAFENFVQRIKNFAEDIEKVDRENIAICTHGAVIAGLTYLLQEKELNTSTYQDFPPPGILTVINKDGVSQIDFRNQTP